jgi:hypothetical protein
MIAARVARRLVRKIVKPAALWVTARALRRAEARAEHLMQLRRDIVPVERRERERAVRLIGRRNQIRGW